MKKAILWVPVVAVALALAGCSSSGSGDVAASSAGSASVTASSADSASVNATSADSASVNATSAGSAPVNAAVSAAKLSVAKYEKAQPPISIPPLQKPAPKDVSLAVLTCANQPSCQAATQGSVDAAKALGWTVKQYESPLTPQGYQATWTSVMQGKPTAIVYSALFPDANIASILSDVKSQHIPTVSISPHSTDAAGSPTATGPAQATVVGPTLYGADGALMGDVVVADAGGPAQALWVWDPNFAAIHGPIKTGFDSVVKGAGGSTSTLEVSVANVGQSVPSQVVSYLQGHPDIKYVVFGVSDFGAGVVPALKQAGLSDKVKLIGRAPQGANLLAVKNGDEFAEIADESAAAGWRATDAIVRLLTKTPVENDVPGWRQIFTKDNVTQTSTVPVTPGLPDSFLSAWKISGK